MCVAHHRLLTLQFVNPPGVDKFDFPGLQIIQHNISAIIAQQAQFGRTNLSTFGKLTNEGNQSHNSST